MQSKPSAQSVRAMLTKANFDASVSRWNIDSPQKMRPT
jgi:hypothetical protein